MCGIVGAVAQRDVSSILLEGLYRLGANRCWSLGMAYEVKTRRIASETVSSTLAPRIGYDLLCGVRD